MEEIFWSKVEKTDSCWLWKGQLDKNGYGKYGSRIFRKIYHTDRAHRISYFLLKGKITKDLQIDHLCKVRNCVNPDHMEPVSQWENTMRSNNYIAINRKKTHCIKGHEFNKENTKINKIGSRSCLRCIDEFHKKRNKERNIKNLIRLKNSQEELKKEFEESLTKKIKTHCIRNHEYTFDNTLYIFDKKRGNIARKCRVCDREKNRKKREIDPKNFREYRIICYHKINS